MKCITAVQNILDLPCGVTYVSFFSSERKMRWGQSKSDLNHSGVTQNKGLQQKGKESEREYQDCRGVSSKGTGHVPVKEGVCTLMFNSFTLYAEKN